MIEHAPRTQGQRLTEVERLAVQAQFLKIFAVVGNVRTACQQVRITRQCYYYWMHHDPEFADLFVLAEAEAVEFLECKAWEFAVDGVEKPIFSRGGVLRDADGNVLTYKEPSEKLLMFLLRARRPEKYRDHPPLVRVNTEVAPPTDSHSSLLEKLRALPE